MKTEEELLAAAEELHARGELSVDRLRQAVGGRQRERLMEIVKRVRAAAAARAMPAAQTSTVEPDLPACLRDTLTRLAADIVRELTAARSGELDRARAAEAAAAARHEAAVRTAETQTLLVTEDLAACEREVEELRGDLDRLTGELTQVKNGAAATEELRRAELERHSQERLGLSQALTRAQEEALWLRLEVGKLADARREAEADAAAARATARSAEAELQRARQDHAALRAQHDTLLRRLSSTEAERDRALEDLRASVEGSGASHAPESPQPAARRRKRRDTVPAE